MNGNNIYSPLKMILSRYLCLLLFVIVVAPLEYVYAQDPGDEEGEMFWGDDDVDYEEEEDDYEEEEDDYYEDDEYEEESYEGEDDSYYDDNESDESEYDYRDDEIESSAKEIDRSGWSVDISGSSAMLVNYTLWKEFGLSDSAWTPGVDARVSIEAPYMFNILGIRFRAGAEFGTFGFTDLTPRAAELKGVTAAGLVSFPAGPGKIKLGTGLFGSSMGFMFEASYGIALGAIDIRLGIRTTEILKGKDSTERELGHLGWMDGIMVLGVNI